MALVPGKLVGPRSGDGQEDDGLTLVHGQILEQLPTMVMTGEADLRTPMGQSEEFYKALKMQKKETLLVRMPDEFHGWRRPSHVGRRSTARLAEMLRVEADFRL